METNALLEMLAVVSPTTPGLAGSRTVALEEEEEDHRAALAVALTPLMRAESERMPPPERFKPSWLHWRWTMEETRTREQGKRQRGRETRKAGKKRIPAPASDNSKNL